MKIKNQISITKEGLCWNILCLKHNINNFAKLFSSNRALFSFLSPCRFRPSVTDMSSHGRPAEFYKIFPSQSPQLSPTASNLDVELKKPVQSPLTNINTAIPRNIWGPELSPTSFLSSWGDHRWSLSYGGWVWCFNLPVITRLQHYCSLTTSQMT